MKHKCRLDRHLDVKRTQQIFWIKAQTLQALPSSLQHPESMLDRDVELARLLVESLLIVTERPS